MQFFIDLSLTSETRVGDPRGYLVCLLFSMCGESSRPGREGCTLVVDGNDQNKSFNETTSSLSYFIFFSVKSTCAFTIGSNLMRFSLRWPHVLGFFFLT